MADVVFLNGEFVATPDARVSVYDGGFLHGAGLFETIRADFGKLFRLDEHLDRMLNSAAKLGLPIERPDLPLSRDFDELLRRSELTTARLRLTVTVGSLYPAAVQTDAPDKTVCVTAAAVPPYPPELLVRGMSVMITTFTQSTADPMAGHKTIAYLPRLLALRSAQQLGCGEALWFTPRNHLAEGCLSSVFVVRDGKLATPPLNTPILPGVSRSVVIEIARAENIPCEEKPLTINDVLDADEIFLTQSSLMVVPVCRVEKKNIGKGKPGPMTHKIREAFVKIVERECKTRNDE